MKAFIIAYLGEWLSDYFMDITQEKFKGFFDKLTDKDIEKVITIKTKSEIESCMNYYKHENVSSDEIQTFLSQFKELKKKVNLESLISCKCNKDQLFYYVMSEAKHIVADEYIDKYKTFIDTFCTALCREIPNIFSKKQFFNKFNIELSIKVIEMLDDVYTEMQAKQDILDDDILLVEGKLVHPISILNNMIALGKIQFSLYNQSVDKKLQIFSKYIENIDVDFTRTIYEDFFKHNSWRDDVDNSFEILLKRNKEDINKKIYELKNILCRAPLSNDLRMKLLGDMKNLKKIAIDKKYDKEIISSINSVIGNINKSFGKVLVFNGGYGSGKSNIVTRIVRNTEINLEERNIQLNIPLSADELIESSSIEDVIIDGIKKFIGIKFDNIVHVNTFFKCFDEYKIRVNFIIDDLQKVCINNCKLYDKMKKFIVDNTRYEWIYWVFSINRNCLYYLFNRDCFLENYSYKFKDKYWLDIDEVNSQHKVGNKIISYYFGNVENQAMVIKENLIGSNPLLAHLYGCVYEKDDLEKHYAYSFKFLCKLTELIMQKIYSVSVRDGTDVEKKALILEDEKVFLDNIIATKTTRIENNFINQNNLIDLSNELEMSSLLKKVIEIKKDELGEHIIKNEKVLIFELFWVYKIVFMYNYIKVNDVDDSVNLYTSFDESNLECNNISELLLNTYILYLDFKNDGNGVKSVIDHIKIIEKREELIFAIDIIKNDYKRYFFDLLEKNTLENMGKAELYALLCYLNNFQVKSEKKCKVISQYLDNEYIVSMSSYLKFVINNIFSNITTLSTLEKCMNNFIGCKNVFISDLLGEISAFSIMNIIKEKNIKLEEAIEFIMSFINKNIKAIKEIRNSITETGCQEARSFTEYLLRHLFRRLIKSFTKDNMIIHDIFWRKRYYYNPDMEIAHIIRQSLSIEYGNYFQYSYSDKFKKSYIKAVNELVKRDGDKRMKIAFHLIYNTVEYGEFNVDKGFYAALHKIKNSHREFYDNDSIKKFIDINLK